VAAAAFDEAAVAVIHGDDPDAAGAFEGDDLTAIAAVAPVETVAPAEATEAFALVVLDEDAIVFADDAAVAGLDDDLTAALLTAHVAAALYGAERAEARVGRGRLATVEGRDGVVPAPLAHAVARGFANIAALLLAVLALLGFLGLPALLLLLEFAGFFALEALARLPGAAVADLFAAFDLALTPIGGRFAASFAGYLPVVPRSTLGRAFHGASITAGGGRDAALILATGARGFAAVAWRLASRCPKPVRFAAFAARGALGPSVALLGTIALAGRHGGVALGNGRRGRRQDGGEQKERDEAAVRMRRPGRRAHVEEVGSVFSVHVRVSSRHDVHQPRRCSVNGGGAVAAVKGKPTKRHVVAGPGAVGTSRGPVVALAASMPAASAVFNPEDRGLALQ
jgi:hypothetical protein